MTQTSWNGIKFICHQEAFVPHAYRDGGTDDAPRYSEGFGSQLPIVRPGDTITIAQAIERVRAHVAANDGWLLPRITAPLLQNEWDAVSSLVYQKWAAGPFVIAKINAHDDLWPEEFNRWIENSKGEKRRGLARRRAREKLLAYDGHYGDIEHYGLWDGEPLRLVEMKEFPNA